MTFPDSPHIVMHIAALLSVVALAFRDQLKLRAALLASITLSTVYHLIEQPGPAWQELPWNVITLIINLIVITQIILDRTHIGLSPEEEVLFSAFGALSPGEFRAITALAAWRTAEGETVLTQENVVPDQLYYVLNGGVDIQKGGRVFPTVTPTFIGEVAFIHGCPASATVRLEPGARYLQWPVKTLQKRISKRHSLRYALLQLIGLDMALKVART